MEFHVFCRDERINHSFAAPKKQAQNHFAELTWQTVNSIACSMVVHAHLPDSFPTMPYVMQVQCSTFSL
jgi:hypothetical protein